ncbi:hypothetical protein [Streptomyces mayteni]
MADLDEVRDELYGLAPEDFTARRDAAAARARGAGDRELAGRIRSLRRPTLAAWACNLLVRAHGEETERFLALGEALRGAQRQLDAERLRELLAEQRTLVAALSDLAAGTAAESGHRLGETARQEVERTLLAALADAESARAWSTGRLTRPLPAPADLPTVTTAAGRATATRGKRASSQTARREARARQAARDAAERDVEAATRRMREARTTDR